MSDMNTEREFPQTDPARFERDIDVAADSTLELTPDNSALKDVFYRVPVSSFDDLQVLGFVPRKLSEEKLRAAMREDDAQAYRMMAQSPQRASHDCDCHGSSPQATSLRASYNSMRRLNNPTVAMLLSEHAGTEVSWDSPFAASVRKFAASARVNRIIVTALLNNITINRNSTLNVSGVTASMLVDNVFIHTTGRLVFKGGHLKLWANSISRFHDFIPEHLVVELKKYAPTWRMS
jgi:hypothetical protein